MEEPKKPRSREKRVVNEGKGVSITGKGLGTGPVNNMGNYADRKEQQAKQAQRPVQGARRPDQSSQRPAQANPFAAPHSSGQRPAQGNPFAAPHSSGQRPAQSTSRPAQAQRPVQSAQRPSAQTQRPGQSGQRASGGCGSKLILIVIAVAVLLGGGKLSGLFDGGGNTGSVIQNVTGGSSGTTSTSSGSGGSGMSNLLGSLLGSGAASSVYENSGDIFSLLMGGASSGGSQGSSLYGGSSSGSSSSGGSSLGGLASGLLGNYFPSASTSSSSGSARLDETVSDRARARYTTLKGKGKDEVTILVYMCGTDLESKNGMGTADLKEMARADIGENVNLLVYTGGCRKWKNNVVSSSVNQIYQIKEGGLYCLEKDMGSASMVSPATLTKFIQYGKENFPANRMCLIFWDHGGGSVSGFGYDEKVGSGTSMSLAGINTALKNGGVTFDFVGFDACLMATVENGIMLSQYADYLIGSEETEPGVGWYYTNWLTKLSANPSLPTIQIGKIIADDFVEVCNQQCRGQGTTLSVVDLAELAATVPSELTAFSTDTNELIQNKEYKKVSSARSGAREFAQSSRIDQIDLVHFARNLGTEEGERLAKALQGAVKYNRTGGGMSNAYGLSIYFPYKRTNKVNQMVSTYEAIGMDEEYTRCIQEFASMELSGQAAGGTMITSSGYGAQTIGMPSLMSSLLGNGSYNGGMTSSQGELMDLLGGLFGNTSTAGGMLDVFTGRTLTAETAAQTILENHLDASALVWTDGRISLTPAEWDQVQSLVKNVYVDTGKGFIDLGTDNQFTLDGNDLVNDFDGTWLSIDGQPVAYYYMNTVEDGNEYVISGYVPALLDGERVNLILNFDYERPYGYIAGAQQVYAEKEADTQGKSLIAVGEGDTLQFICEFYDYEGNYQDTYPLGQPLTLGKETEIANTPIGSDATRVTYCFTDYYQQRYWTPTIK